MSKGKVWTEDIGEPIISKEDCKSTMDVGKFTDNLYIIQYISSLYRIWESVCFLELPTLIKVARCVPTTCCLVGCLARVSYVKTSYLS